MKKAMTYVKRTVKILLLGMLAAVASGDVEAESLGRKTLSPEQTQFFLDITTKKSEVLNFYYVDIEVPPHYMATVSVQICPSGCAHRSHYHRYDMSTSGRVDINGAPFGCGTQTTAGTWSGDVYEHAPLLNRNADLTPVTYVYGGSGGQGLRIGVRCDSSDYSTGYIAESFLVKAVYEELKPDLSVKSLTAQSGKIALKGRPMDFKFVIENAGYENAPATTAMVLYDNSTLKTIDVPALSCGSEKEFSYTLVNGMTTEGDHTFAVSVASGGADRDTANNSKSITIGTPRLSLEKSGVEVSAGATPETTVKVLGNTSCHASVDVSSRGWLTVASGSPSSGLLKFGVARNSSAVSRQGVITIANDFGQSCQLSVRQAGMTAPAVPVVTVSQRTSSATMDIRTTTEAKALRYVVYRSESPSGGFSQIGVVEGSSFVDTTGREGRTYYYKVVAENEVGSVAGAVVSCYVKPTLVAPACLRTGAFSGKVVAIWSHPVKGVVVRYTRNGTEPTETSEIWPVGGIVLDANATLRARAFKSRYWPSVGTTGSYTKLSIPNAPNVTVIGTELTVLSADVKFFKVYRASNPFDEPVAVTDWLEGFKCAVAAPTALDVPLFYYVKVAPEKSDAGASSFSATSVPQLEYYSTTWPKLTYPNFVALRSQAEFHLLPHESVNSNWYSTSSVSVKSVTLQFHKVQGDSEISALVGHASNYKLPLSSYQWFDVKNSPSIVNVGLFDGWKLTLKALANTSRSPRAYSFYSTGCDETANLENPLFWPLRPHYVYQSGVPYLSLSKSSFAVGEAGDVCEIDVHAVPLATDWSATATASWIVPVRAASQGSGVLRFYVCPNEGGERTGTLAIQGAGITQRVEIRQSAAALPPDDPAVDLNAPVIASVSGDDSAKVTVVWGDVSDATTYQVYRSTTPTRPVSAIASGLSSTTWSDTSALPGVTYYYWVQAVAGAMASPVSNCRSGYRRVTVATGIQSRDIVAAGGVESITVKANADWSVETTASWISLLVASGVKDGAFRYSVAANDQTVARTGTITVTAGKNTDHPVQAVVTIRQMPTAIADTTYTIVFNGNGATSGAMPHLVCEHGKVFVLPKCAFGNSAVVSNSVAASVRVSAGSFSAGRSANKRFAGWACSNGRRYDDGMLVFDLARPGETVTMTAIWE